MCGVVNVTHVERRGHDQVGSGWQDSAFDASSICVRMCICVCVFTEGCQGLAETTETLWMTGWLPRTSCARNENSPVIVMGFQ